MVTIGGRGQCRGGGVEVETIGCKTGSRAYGTTWRIQPIFHSNCKWKVTPKIVCK